MGNKCQCSFSLEEVVENKLTLRKLKPNAQSLKYVRICEIGETVESLMVYLNFKKDDPLEKDFEKYAGLSLRENPPGCKMLKAYNNALKREIEEIKSS